jgi:hypothetical protein
MFALLVLLVACGSGGEPDPTPIIVIARPTTAPIVVTVVASPTPLPPSPELEPSPGTADTLPSPGPSPQPRPGETFDQDDFWTSFPLPQDADIVPAVEGIDLAYTTRLVEPQVFDFYSDWLESQGWDQQAPTEAMVTLPNQRWRKDVAELHIEIPGQDTTGRTEVWVQLAFLTTDAPPKPVGKARDELPAAASSVPSATSTPVTVRATATLAPGPATSITTAPPSPKPPDSATIAPDNVHLLAEATWTHVGPNTHSLAWSPVPGGPLAVGESAQLNLYDPDTLDPLPLSRQIEAGNLAFSPDGSQLAVTRFVEPAHFYVDLWRVADWTLLQKLGGHTNTVTDFAFSPDGRLLASASMDSSVRVWDTGNGQLFQELKPVYQGIHSPAVLSTAWTADGSFLVAGMDGGWVEAWATGDWRQAFRFQASDGNQPNHIFPLPDGRLLTLNGYTASLWSLDGGRLARMESEWGFYSGAVSPGGLLLANGSLEGVEFWDLYQARVLHRMAVGDVQATAFGPYGANVATLEGSDDLLRRWAVGPAQASDPLADQYSEVWQRLGGASGRLGQPLDPPEDGTFAFQHFESGLMHWGRWDRQGEPEREVQVIVNGGGGGDAQSGELWGRFVDFWEEGQDEYSCAEAMPPYGPRRGFGLVWCRYVRESLGAPLEEEYGQEAGYQDYEYGTLLWSPSDGGIYVLFNEGDWHFEPVK